MIITQTPLRVGLVGGGTDLPGYYREHGGRVLNAAIDKYVYVIVKQRFDDEIYVNYSTKEIVSRVEDLQHELVREAMHMAGVIILITAAGGAFGAMIGHSGIGKTIEELGQSGTIHFVILAWAVAAVFKIAQGSGTVSMLTTSAIMANSLPDTLEFHRIYIYLAIGFGSIFGSWMNDSGFWVVGRMSGFSEKETLRTWTVLLAAIGVMGLVLTWILAMVLPFASGPGA